jgi:hypothetical protein
VIVGLSEAKMDDETAKHDKKIIDQAEYNAERAEKLYSCLIFYVLSNVWSCR